MTTKLWGRRATASASPRRWWVLLALGVTVAAGCGADGMTPGDCPELPLYALRSAAGSNSAYHLTPAQQAVIQEAIDIGCLTPAGTATSLEAGAP